MKTFRAKTGPFKEQTYYQESDIENMCSDELRSTDLFPSTPGPVRIDRFIEKRFNVVHSYEDLGEGILTIRQTKFGKTRLVPLHTSTRDVMADYARRRDLFLRSPSAPCFFLNDHGRRLEVSAVRRTFYELSRQIGLRGPEDHKGPRLHDFRHRL